MVALRKSLKILHSLASCGLIGGLAVYMLLLTLAPQDSLSSYADLRAMISAISDYVLLPSLGVGLVTGLLAMVVHKPFMNKRWAWLKAAMGILMFKGVLAVIGSNANHAADLTRKIADGEMAPEMLDLAIANEWLTLWVVMALSIANVVLGVWRPKLKRMAQPHVGYSAGGRREQLAETGGEAQNRPV